jgi:hypothetical protein
MMSSGHRPKCVEQTAVYCAFVISYSAVPSGPERALGESQPLDDDLRGPSLPVCCAPAHWLFAHRGSPDPRNAH